MNYPDTPGWKESDTETSRDAALDMAGQAATLRQQCLELLRQQSLTADEVADALGKSVLAIRPRITELKAKNLIAASDERRPNRSGKKAVVWRSVP